jgi:hypothetical protein
MSGKGPFRHVGKKSAGQVDIETLFRDLKSRSPKIQALFAHQADILRDYQENHISSPDVSLELPTGSGKTLVGLLIADWRRKTRHERVVYLCPTKQLANQVAKHAQEYGIAARVFTGSKKTYDRQDLVLYQKAEVVAITTYSGLFNINPGIDDPQVIILDDAHSSEAYIASMWSVLIQRDSDPELYSKVLSIFEKDMPTQLVSTLYSEERPQMIPKPEAVPFGSLHKNLDALRITLNSAIVSHEDPGFFAWTMIRDSLKACHVYFTWDEILIRPYIPPTLTHRPFAGANQRIYMSATLGHSGELERITGVRSIERIPTPKTYRSRGIGRRLFLFPDLVADSEEYMRWIADLVAKTPRTLVLCPTNKISEYSKRVLAEYSPSIKLLSAFDIEDSTDVFLNSEPSALILANRYDGLDLPDGICRLLILNGLPTGTNIQEAFLEQRIGLDVLLRERIKTRISQAVGRCTRSDTDYVAVIMTGKTLLDFCVKHENRRIFHPELRSELDFSLDQDATALSHLEEMVKVFLAHGKDWNEFEQDIIQNTVEGSASTQISEILSKVAHDEVDFSYTMWSGDFAKAVEIGRRVVDQLSGPNLSVYRALWYYFVATAAYSASKTNPEQNAVVLDFIKRAANTCKTVSWFPNALKSMQPQSDLTHFADDQDTLAIEHLVDVLTELGAVGPKFSRKVEEVSKLVTSVEFKKFDSGMEELGQLLGFESWRPSEEAAPDCVWQLDGKIAFLLEGKSEESPNDPISVDDCRQASGHLNWAKTHARLKECEEVWSILVTPRVKIDNNALPHAEKIFTFKTTQMKELFERAVTMLSTVRSSMATVASEELRDSILQEIISKNLAPQSIRSILLSKPASKLPKV